MSKSIEIDNLINNQLYGFRIFPRNLKGQYQTELDSATATATPKAFQLPTYTGQHAIFGNETEGRIEMYTSGTLNLSAGIYDVFAVGAGGGTRGTSYQTVTGGGGGYTTTNKNIALISNMSIAVIIGTGSPSVDGGNTVVGENTPLMTTATGGQRGTSTMNGGAENGGYGGSGGGAGQFHGYTGYDGGSDGADAIKGGKGQGTTTRAFGEVNGTLYAGGGGGSSTSTNGKVAQGGAGGGGDGGNPNGTSSKNGVPNTGGGGGGADYNPDTQGGSGIAIIRWKNS